MRVFGLLIGLWELAGKLNMLNELLLPAPGTISAAFFEMWFQTGEVRYHFLVTIYEVFMGFIIGSFVGLSLATIAALSPVFRRYIAPYAVALNVTPGIALAPIIVAWFGFGVSSKIALAALVAFFPLS